MGLKIDLGGTKLDVTVTDRGMFSCVWDGHEYDAETLKLLEVRMRAAARTRKARVNIPVYMWRSDRYGRNEKLIPVTITGKHAANGNILYKVPGEKGIEQSRGYHSDEFYRLTPTQAEAMRAARTAVRTATKELEALQEKHKFPHMDIGTRIDELITSGQAEIVDSGTEDPRV